MTEDRGTTPWRPLSVREGRADVDGPFEGIPAHLKVPVDEWLLDALDQRDSWNDDAIARQLAIALRITGDPQYSRSYWLRTAAKRDDEKALDILDATLFASDGRTADNLETLLVLGGSVWAVNDAETGLVRRISRTEQDSYRNAVQIADPATEQLETAWGKVFGRQPDYSDAWDHAIKACEALLAPIVLPKSSTSTLGSIISAIDQKPDKFSLTLSSSHRELTNVQTFVGMLRLIWPNPDRHETGPSRPPTAEEARDVVHLAVTIVNWVRQGSFTVA